MKTAKYFLLLLGVVQGLYTPSPAAAEQVTVLVAYTASARQFVDETPNLFYYRTTNDVVTQALFDLNLALANSGVTSFTVAFARAPFEVTWEESGNPLTELSKMRANGSILVAMRDSYKADIVVLAVRALVGAAGAGYIPGMPGGYVGAPKEESLANSVGKGSHAYTVCDIEAMASLYVTNRYVLAHEIGHNLGLLHDETTCINEAAQSGVTLDVLLDGRPTNYAHGYHDQSDPAQWHDIMSYPKDGSTRILYYSNPNLTPSDAGNDAIGVWDIGRTIYAYSAKLLQDNASIYASWRTPCTGISCSKYCRVDASVPLGYRCVDCLDNSHCSNGGSCMDGTCVYINACTNANCGPNQICKEDASAPNGYRCVDNPCPTCPDKCVGDPSAPSGWKCVECKSNSQCPEGYECANNACVSKSQHCSPSPCPSATPYCSESAISPYYRCDACAQDANCALGKVCRFVEGTRRCVPSYTCSKNHSISLVQANGACTYTINWGNGAVDNATYTTGRGKTRTWVHTYKVTHAYGETVNYGVSVTYKGSNSVLASNTASINCATALPIISIAASPTSGVLPVSTAFTYTNTGGPIDVWNWDFGDGGISTGQNPTHLYNTAGKFTVRLTVTGPGGSVTATKFNYINITALPPVINFHASRTIGSCPFAVTFTATNTGGPVYGWAWAFGDGATSSVQNSSHTYTKPGQYTVTLTATGPTASDVEAKAGYVNARANMTPILDLLLSD